MKDLLEYFRLLMEWEYGYTHPPISKDGMSEYLLQVSIALNMDLEAVDYYYKDYSTGVRITKE